MHTFWLLLAACSTDYELKPGPVDVNPGDVTACAFTRVEDSAFYRYDCNPVFSVAATGDSWAGDIGSVAFAVTEVLDHPFYQAWYVGAPSASDYGDYGIGYAVSPNGTDWESHPENPLLEEPAASAWDGDMMDALQVVWDPETAQYVMLYQGFNIDLGRWGMGVATSSDGVGWAKLPSNPVVDFTESAGMAWCWPLGLSLGSVAGFTGYAAGARGSTSGNDACELYRINASNVNDWQPDSERVMAAGASGQWDDEGFLSVAVEEIDNQRYLFYAGFGGWEEHGTYRSTKNQFFGYAIEEDDGWVRRGQIPLHMTAGGEVSAVAARRVGGRIHLWVTDVYEGTSAIGYFLFDPVAAAAEDATL
jgi:hypothetical protein